MIESSPKERALNYVQSSLMAFELYRGTPVLMEALNLNPEKTSEKILKFKSAITAAENGDYTQVIDCILDRVVELNTKNG